ncbi:glycosyltransferase family 2 protein [Rosistilla oblonga]|uniref:glycosyltransferase family 2 protein n=1 Tax=Rosistilla oblonga TaxID=2527990 RepID=UPI0011A44679|nr:glycosyltransferase family A protein [Rosistilla oblonga]
MKISVVIPCYNRANQIGRAIASVRAQTVPVGEIIVVDDGSTDNTVGVALSYGEDVRVLSQANAGAASARNRGIETACGEWVAFLDSDDEWHPEKIERQLDASSRFPGADLIFCDTMTRSAGQILMPSRFSLGGLYGAEVQRDGDKLLFGPDLFQRMITQSRVITSAVMVRGGLDGFSFPEDIWGSEDWALWLGLAKRYTFAAVDQILVTMYQQGDNISGTKGRLYRNDVKVLERLLECGELTDVERQHIRAVLQQRRVGAVYHSLVRGEGAEAREILRNIPPGNLGRLKRLAYNGFSFLPRKLACRIAALRGC